LLKKLQKPVIPTTVSSPGLLIKGIGKSQTFPQKLTFNNVQ
jgi:hypothetical protein